MDEQQPVEYLSTWIPVTEEMLIDLGMGTPEMIERDRLRHVEFMAWRRSWRGRTAALRSALHGARYRLSHAANALRGIDCERDY